MRRPARGHSNRSFLVAYRMAPRSPWATKLQRGVRPGSVDNYALYYSCLLSGLRERPAGAPVIFLRALPARVGASFANAAIQGPITGPDRVNSSASKTMTNAFNKTFTGLSDAESIRHRL